MKYFCKRFVNISAIKANVQFSNYKSMANLSCHSNQTDAGIAIMNNSFVETKLRSFL